MSFQFMRLFNFSFHERIIIKDAFKNQPIKSNFLQPNIVKGFKTTLYTK